MTGEVSICKQAGRCAGFTLIELLVVIAIIAMLVSILVPSLGEATWQAKMAVCSQNLHSLGLAITGYMTAYEMDHPFIFDGGKVDRCDDSDDTSRPAPGNPALAMANPAAEIFIDDPRVFFCPIVDEVNYEDNYVANPLRGLNGGEVWGTYLYAYPHLMPDDDPFHPWVDNTYSHDNARENIGPHSENVVMYDDLFDPYDHCNVLELNGIVNMLGTYWPPMDRYL